MVKDKSLHRSVIWFRIKRILKYVTVTFFAIFLFINTFLQTTTLQSYLAHIVSKYLSEQLQIKIEIEQVKISLMMDVMLKGVRINDARQNEMITIKYFYARLNSAQLARKVFRLSEVEMVEGGFSMRKYKGDSFFNYTDLIGIPDTLAARNPDINFELHCRNTKLTDCYFNMVNENNPSRNGFDWNNMYLKLDRVDGRNLVVCNDSIVVDIKNIVVSDTSGFRLNKFTTTMKFLDDGWYFDNTFILTPTSTLDFDMKFGYSSFEYINAFEDSITIIADLRPSILDIQDVAYFAEVFKEFILVTDIETQFAGTLKDFSVSNFKMDFGKNSSLFMDAHVRDILEIEKANLHASVHTLRTSWGDIQRLNLPIGTLSLPPPLLNPVSLILQFDGGINDFRSDLSFQTSIGEVIASLNMKWDEALKEYAYQLEARSGLVHVGMLADMSDILGDGVFNIAVQGTGLSLKTADINVEAILNYLVFNDYKYENIHIDGIFQQQKFNGFLGISDKNVDLNFRGSIDIGDSLPAFDFQLALENMYLTRLNFISNRSDDLHVSTHIEMKAKGNSIDNMFGTLNISDFKAIETGEVYAFDSLNILTYQPDNVNRNMRIQSDLLEARIHGEYRLSHLGDAFKMLIGNYLASIRHSSDNQFDLSYHLDWYINIKDISPVTRFFIPELQIPNGLLLEQDIDFEEENLLIKCHSPKIIYNGINFFDFQLLAQSQSFGTTLETGFGKISLVEQNDSTIFGFEDFKLNSLMRNDSIKYSLSWDRKLGEVVEISFLDGVIDFKKFPTLSMALTDMSIILRDNDGPWLVSPDNLILYDDDKIIIDSLKFYSGNAFAFINGSLSSDSASLLHLAINKWDMSIANELLGDLGLNVLGFVSGKVELINPYNDLTLKSDLILDTLKLNDNDMGNATLALNWENKHRALFIDLNSVLQGKRGTTNPINVHGHYYPDAVNDNIDLSVKLENFGLNILNPFLYKFVSDIGGYLSGSLNAKGTITNPLIDGKFSVQRGAVRILYTGALYSLSGDIIAGNDEFAFSNFTLYDTLSNVAALEGGIRHKAFTDFQLDVRLKPEKFILLSTGRYDNDIFYGTVIATGDVSFTGPFSNIRLAASVTTDQNTDVSVPLNSAKSVGESTFVIFKQISDSLSVDEAFRRRLSSNTGFSLFLNLRMTPDGQIRIFLPDNLGRINAGGTGNIILSVDNSGNFAINGTYTISRGDFYLTLNDLLLNKRLILNKGSYIRFDGDPLNADVNVSATYEVQTTLSNLNVPLDSSIVTKRIPVNCIIHMREKLMNPELSFSIEFPTLGEDNSAVVYSRMDTTNQEEMTRQAFSLLLLGTFNADEGGFSAGSLASSSINVITNQLNNFLSQVFKGIDVGINYRGGDRVSADEFDLFVRKGLFNDRLIIDANVGTVDNTSRNSSRSSTIVGDASVELKLTEDGRWRLKGFTRSNANDISKIGTNNEYGYTYGVGLGFQRSYNSIKDIAEQQKAIRMARKERKALKKEKKQSAVSEDSKK